MESIKQIILHIYAYYSHFCQYIYGLIFIFIQKYPARIEQGIVPALDYFHLERSNSPSVFAIIAEPAISPVTLMQVLPISRSASIPRIIA